MGLSARCPYRAHAAGIPNTKPLSPMCCRFFESEYAKFEPGPKPFMTVANYLPIKETHGLFLAACNTNESEPRE